MHYYKRNLGDYAKKAGRLSMLQHGAYTLLIDACYDREQFPTMEEAIDWTWASSSAEIEAVQFVLAKFFTLIDGRYVQNRIQEEIAQCKTGAKKHWAALLPKHIRASIQAGRNATKLNATPKWLTKNQRSDIAAIYAEAATKTASTGVRHQVDHIIPLRSKIVCGLHVAWNLRVITAEENMRKSNIFEVC
jgi:uncharacterized protein YdaU (DUF1376 family)